MIIFILIITQLQVPVVRGTVSMNVVYYRRGPRFMVIVIGNNILRIHVPQYPFLTLNPWHLNHSHAMYLRYELLLYCFALK